MKASWGVAEALTWIGARTRLGRVARACLASLIHRSIMFDRRDVMLLKSDYATCSSFPLSVKDGQKSEVIRCGTTILNDRCTVFCAVSRKRGRPLCLWHSW